jgi:hypothetical protein
MRKIYKVGAAILSVVTVIPAFAAKKIEGTATLRDSKPAGVTDKTQKHQAYDLWFDAAGNRYMCRTGENKPMNATDFVVGSMVSYEIDGQKAKIKTAEGKKVDCRIVRVETIGAPAPPAQQ